MTKRKVKKISSVIAWILIVLLLLGGIAALLQVGKTVQSSALSVSYTDEETGKSEMLVDAKTDMVFLRGNVYEFQVMGDGSFTVEVLPNDAVDFEYRVNGLAMRWQDQGPLVGGLFTPLILTDGGFKLDFTDGFSFKSLYKGKAGDPSPEVELPPEVSMSAPFFTLRISSADGESVFEVDFAIMGNVESVELDRNSIVF